MRRDAELKAKALIDDSFELIEKLDDRGLGEVWKARDPNFKTRFFLLKFLRATETEAEIPDELDGVIRRLRTLKHPNLLQVTASGLWSDRPYLAQSWFEGASLVAAMDDLRAKAHTPSRASLERLVDLVCAALEALHGLDPPWVHGGLHPGCVLVQRASGGEFEVRVIDVGLAPFADGGTAYIYPDCVAPERKEGRPLHPTMDVYSLAMVMRRALREADETRAYVAPFGDYRGREDVPAAVWEVMARATRAAPAERYESVKVMRAALKAAWKSEARLTTQRPGAPGKPAEAALAVAESAPRESPPSLDRTGARVAEASGASPVAAVMPALTAPREAARDEAGAAFLSDLLGKRAEPSTPPAASAAPREANAWSTSVLQREVSVRTALVKAREGADDDRTEMQAPAAEKNPWATEVLKERVQVDEELIPTTLKESAAPLESGAPIQGASAEPVVDTLIAKPRPRAEPVDMPTVAKVRTSEGATQPTERAGLSRGAITAAVAIVLVGVCVALGLLVFGR